LSQRGGYRPQAGAEVVSGSGQLTVDVDGEASEVAELRRRRGRAAVDRELAAATRDTAAAGRDKSQAKADQNNCARERAADDREHAAACKRTSRPGLH
jgi:hypothetical protein